MKKVLKIISNVLEVHVPAISIFVLFLSMFLQVILRYGFKHPSPELFEISSYTFVWTVLLGAALANRYRNHIKFDIIYNKLPQKARIVIDILFDSFFSVLLIISLFPVIKQSIWYRIIKSEVLGIPWTYLIICLPLMMILITIQNGLSIYKNILEILRKTGEQ
ncbi:TRAP transporter small permease [Pseudothermotoga lettingae]|jgi:TRAP-type C4-dicarboxylate transport system permease small subunit|uniref:TRAP transporter small permease n=1 Tax=Pseudothermotoga lettingae TaxID=177758 RepID=UPI000748C2C9|nr:TRAP transporter small permease [Pseudothermotoga lettingae]KUK20752.1 MAG: Tripartite ATP-independent periplasmic transporter DctQ component [Pseudothermotoga lettingae]MDI3495912.1 TRAP-type transport system small permease protein [Pseudothermotoga sp.]HBT25263.1 TRAP transporter small permease [Pseudothermotoga sp.]